MGYPGEALPPSRVHDGRPPMSNAAPLLEHLPDVEFYAPGSWGPAGIHQLIEPHGWRLPFERARRRADTAP